MYRAPLCLTIFVATLALNTFAQVSPSYRDWGKSAVHDLMMKQEKVDWASVRTDSDAKAFIELFWARRDPTPDTPLNELQQQLETAIADADKRFRSGKTPGSHTDQGRVYTLLGEPAEIRSRTTRPSGGSAGMAQFQRPINIETWIYRNEAAERVAGTKSFDIAFVFHDERAATEFELDGQSRRSFDSTALVKAQSVIRRPFLTAAELASGAVRTVPLRIVVVADRTIALDVLRRTQEAENFAGLARKYSLHPSAQQGGYLGRMSFVDLPNDFKVALAGKEAGTAVLITRGAEFAIIRILTEAEAAAADAEMPRPK